MSTIPSWVYLDVETGGFDKKVHAIVEIGWAILDQTLTPLTGDSICILPEPGFHVDPQAALINGYTPEGWEERGAISLAEAKEAVLAKLGEYTGLPKIAHNAFSMDKPWVTHHFGFFSPPEAKWVCTKEMLRKHFQRQNLKPGKGDLTLDNLCKLAEYRRVDRHSAMEDSYAGAAGARWLVGQGIPVA